MTTLRVKLQVGSVFPHINPETNETASETLQLHGFPITPSTDGLDPDNSFAKWSSSVSLQIQVTNPALFNTFVPGQKFHVDFSPAD